MIFSDSHQTLWRLVRLDTSCCCCKLCFSRWRLSICLEPCSRAILSLKTTLCLCGYVMKDPTVCFDNYSSCIQINQDRLVAQLQSVEVIQFLKLHFAWPRMMLLQLLDLLLLQQRLCVDSFFRQGILCETGASQFFLKTQHNTTFWAGSFVRGRVLSTFTWASVASQLSTCPTQLLSEPGRVVEADLTPEPAPSSPETCGDRNIYLVPAVFMQHNELYIQDWIRSVLYNVWSKYWIFETSHKYEQIAEI